MVVRSIGRDGYRTLLVVVFATATGTVAVATFDYMLVEMQQVFDFSVDVGNAVTIVPTIMTLLVVFVAGSLGDHLGHRRVMMWGGGAFCAGAAMVLVAPSLAVAIVGRSLEGVGGATLAISALSLLSNHFNDPRKRAAVFGLYAAIVPAITLVAPIFGALIADGAGWRLVPVGWLVFGVATLAVCWHFVDPHEARAESREIVTPLLAGVALAAIAATATSTYKSAPVSIASAMIAVGSIGLLAIVYRRSKRPGLDLSILRTPGAKGALVAIILANSANVVYWTTLLMHYRYQLSLPETAMTMMPVELAAVLGGLFGGVLLGRFGAVKAAVIGLSAAAGVGFACIVVIQESPRALPVALAALFAFAGMSSTGPLAENLLNRVPKTASGAASAFRGAAIAIGATVGGAVIGFFVLSEFETSLSRSLQQAKLTAVEADELAEALRDGAEVDSTSGNYSIPFDEVQRLVDGQSYEVGKAEADAFSMVGLGASAAKGLAVVVLLTSSGAVFRRRRRPGNESGGQALPAGGGLRG